MKMGLLDIQLLPWLHPPLWLCGFHCFLQIPPWQLFWPRPKHFDIGSLGTSGKHCLEGPSIKQSFWVSPVGSELNDLTPAPSATSSFSLSVHQLWAFSGAAGIEKAKVSGVEGAGAGQALPGQSQNFSLFTGQRIDTAVSSKLAIPIIYTPAATISCYQNWIRAEPGLSCLLRWLPCFKQLFSIRGKTRDALIL